MLFIILIPVLSKFLQVNAVQCMQGTAGGSTCEFELNLNQPVPSDKDLKSNNCEVRDSTGTVFGFHVACYGEVAINYMTNTIRLKWTDVYTADSWTSPLDHMFGLLDGDGVKSVTQYKIKGNFENKIIKMVTRVQCDTKDNCAFEKIRELLPNLVIADQRRAYFRKNQSGSEHTCTNIIVDVRISMERQLHLTLSIQRCTDSNEQETGSCGLLDSFCKFQQEESLSADKSCGLTAFWSAKDELEYRFNNLNEKAATVVDKSQDAFKCYFRCTGDKCNSNAKFNEVNVI